MDEIDPTDDVPSDGIPMLTKLDLANLETLVDGQNFTAECGVWSVHHYGKKGGVVFLSQAVEIHGAPAFEFKSTADIKRFLMGEKVVAKPISIMI